MPPFPLGARVLEVIADRGKGCTPRYLLGSGCLVAGRTVLTAAHVVAEAVSVRVRGTDKVFHQAAVDPEFISGAEGPGPDLALIEIIDSVIDAPPMGLAAVTRDSPAGDPVERCHALGYPEFMERETSTGGRFRETADALGQVPVLSGLAGGLLSVQVSSSPEPLPPAQVALGDSPWSGMSGGPVVTDGFLLGVVTEHAPRAGSSTITATPLTALEADPAHPGWGPGVADPGAWWARLGIANATELKRLPPTPGRGKPAYWATVQEIRQRTGVLAGRQHELAAIAAFTTGDEAYRWLVGESWAGKTSLLAESVLTLPADIDVVCYFLSRREADADSSGFLSAVVPQLAQLLGEDPAALELLYFRDLWLRAIERAAKAGHHLLLVVDGLDEDLRPPGLPSVAALLPVTAGGWAHVLVSSRPHPELPADVPVGHPLRSVEPVLVEPFAGAQELAVLARQEIDDLLRRDDDGLAVDVLGLLTAAAGPLAVRDLAAITTAASLSAALTRRIRELVTTSAARSLQPVRPAGSDRYQFAHESLLAYSQADSDLNDPDFRHRIHRWAVEWRDAGWPTPAGGETGTPLYLLDNYASTLTHDRQRLAQLTGDIGWITAVIASAGVDRVQADLRRALAANPSNVAITAGLTAVTGQAHNLRIPQPVYQPGYILRQLWMQSAELDDNELADNICARLQSLPGPCLMPRWTTRHASRALSGVLGLLRALVWSVAVLSDGRVVTGESDGRVLLWNPADPGTDPAELGRHLGLVWSVTALSDGRVITTGRPDGRVLLWNPADPGKDPVELGRHEGTVRAVTVLSDGRVVTGGDDGRILLWDLADPSSNPIELGRHFGGLRSVAALGNRRVVSGGVDGRVLAWDLSTPGADPVELGHHEDTGHNERIVRFVAVLPDERVVSVGVDGRMLVWDSANAVSPTEFGRGHIGTVGAVAVLGDGRIVTGGADQRVLIWDPADPGATPTELGRHEGMVRTVAVFGDGQVVTGGDRRVLIWNLAASRGGRGELDRRYEGTVRAVALLDDGRIITGSDRYVLVWNPNHLESPTELGHHHRQVRSVAVLSGGAQAVSGGEDGRVLLWNLADPGSNPVELGRHVGTVCSVAALRDARVASGGIDGRVLVWDPAHPTGRPVELGHRPVSAVQAVTELPDGRIVTGGNQEILLWDLANPTAAPIEVGRHNGAVRCVTGLPDGRVATGGTDQRVLVWNLAEAGSQVYQLNCSVTALAATPPDAAESNLAIAHSGGGFSFWSFIR